MFNIGLPELIIILVVALIIFGPNKLPELAKTFGKAMRELKKATEEMKENFEAETKDLEELKGTLSDEKLLADLAEEPPVSTPYEELPSTAPAATEPEGSVTDPLREETVSVQSEIRDQHPEDPGEGEKTQEKPEEPKKGILSDG